jgi:hypothetical protein
MKIIEAQSAVLTNYEVYTHLIEQRDKYASKGLSERRPGNLETIVREVYKPQNSLPSKLTICLLKQLLAYFAEAPSPLGSYPFPYNKNTIRTLLTRLRRWDFTKAEIIMIMNLRPTKPETLNTIVEQMEERFPGDELQAEICAVIADVLGRPDGEAERKAMTSNAEEARAGLGNGEGAVGKDVRESMEVDV